MERGLGNTAICLNADVEFHFAISQAAHNRLLLNAVQLIRNLMRQWISKTLKVPGTPAEALRQHKDILAAIANKDKAGAQAAMFFHLDEMSKVLLRIKGAVDVNGKQPASPTHRTRRSTSAATID